MEKEYAVEVQPVDDLDKRQLLFISKNNIEKGDLVLSIKENIEAKANPTIDPNVYCLGLNNRFYKINKDIYSQLELMGAENVSSDESKKKNRKVIEKETSDRIKKMLKVTKK